MDKCAGKEVVLRWAGLGMRKGAIYFVPLSPTLDLDVDVDSHGSRIMLHRHLMLVMHLRRLDLISFPLVQAEGVVLISVLQARWQNVTRCLECIDSLQPCDEGCEGW